MKKLLLIFILTSLLFSCRTQQDVLYLQNIDNIDFSKENYQSPEIQVGDVLTIMVSAYDEDLAKPFNLGGNNTTGIRQGTSELSSTSYLVDSEGYIEYPMLGSIQVAGKTRKELAEDLKNRISNYIKDPMVNIRIVNFEVTMLGEFNSQGVVKSASERLNIFEAIANSGGMSFYAIRDSVLIIRSENGKRKHDYVNLHDANIMNSEYYYLKQNDILYALPTKSRATEFNTRPLTSTLTVIGFITAIITLFR
ncbi:polysaccharide export protein [Flavobacteriaceae bacterium Ap0902]|nr:polysaccharide export protein [Flavobacteriaceae bacterium Ap0902]